MELCIIGSGYVGLVSGACFAEVGHHVVCVDNDQRKVEKLQRGEIPIYEPGLEEIVHRNVASRRLRFTNSIEDGVDHSQVVFIAVPTPPQPDGSVDLTYIERVAREIAGVLKPQQYRVVVDKSTVPVKTGEKVADTIRRYNRDAEFDVVSNPEFLREGCAVADLMNPDRVVIGSASHRATDLMKRIYEPFKAPILVTDVNSAELIKHAANSFLSLKISYINAVSAICEASGADVELVADGIGMDRRIGRNFLNAGPRLRRLVLSEGREGVHRHRAPARHALQAPGGGRGDQQPPARALHLHRARRALGAEGQEDRGLGTDLQARHRRRAQLRGHRARQPARRRRRAGDRVRSEGRGEGRRVGPDRPGQSEARADAAGSGRTAPRR